MRQPGPGRGSKILLAVDGSDTSHATLAAAAEMAGQLHSGVVVLIVREPGFEAGSELGVAAGEMAIEFLDGVVAELTGLGVAAEPALKVAHQGGPAAAILAAASERRPELIVMGSRMPSDIDGLLHGSVAHGVIHGSSCPVLVVPLHDGGRKPSAPLLSRIVIAVDGSEPSQRAAATVTRLAVPAAQALILHVREEEAVIATVAGAAIGAVGRGRWDLEGPEAAGRLVGGVDSSLRQAGFRVRHHVGAGTHREVAAQIGTAARDFNATLIVIGSRGRSDLGSLMLGSVAHGVLKLAACPVLIVR